MYCVLVLLGELKYEPKESLDDLKMKIGNLKVELREEMVKEDNVREVSLDDL